jgi:23S rRNA (uracil1939-C5)-methyltransferase
LTDIVIDRLGAKGDGVGHGADGASAYVPFALPGERVTGFDPDGGPRIAEPSPDRVAPVCQHFGVCGNCVAQHMSAPLYRDWKRGIVEQALRARGLDAEVDPLRVIPAGSRRRTSLALFRGRGGPALGYRRRKSHDLFAVEECPVLIPGIAGLLSRLTKLLGTLAPNKGAARVSVMRLDDGFDVAVDDVAAPGGRRREAFAHDAIALGIVRLTICGDPIFQTGPAHVRIAGIPAPVAPGGFLQASEEAEIILTELVLEGVGDVARVADLFAGSGTFSLALARSAAVTAVESDAGALAALDKAVRHATGLKPVTTRHADLFRAPFTPSELDRFGAVVFDPPRAGASAQMEMLARSKVGRVVAVSCNPATLARDLRILVDGGYAIDRVTPVDQFVYAAEVEAVAILSR